MSANVTHRHLPAGQRLTVTADSISSGSVVLVENGTPSSSPVSVPVGATRYFGPFPSGRDYKITSATGLLTIAEAGNVSGAVGNLTAIPDGRDMVLDENAQSLVFGSLTVNGSYTVNGELRVQDWPT